MTSAFMWVGDVHLSDTPPGWRTDDYTDQIFAKLEFIVAEALQREVDVVFAGDLFHHRRRVSHALLARLMRLLSDTGGIDFYVIPGNHDILENRLSSIPDQPLGILGQLENVYVLDDPSHPALIGSTSVPITIWPVPYQHNLPYEACRVPDPAEGLNVLAVHYGITDHVMPYPTLVTEHEDWDPFPGRTGVVLSGHIHDDLGEWRDRHGNMIVNPGAISRGALTEHNLSRTPRFLVIDYAIDDDVEEIGIASIDLPVFPADQVFRLAEAGRPLAGDDDLATEFLTELQATQLSVFSPEDVIARITELHGPTEPQAADAAITAIQEAVDA